MTRKWPQNICCGFIQHDAQLVLDSRSGREFAGDEGLRLAKAFVIDSQALSHKGIVTIGTDKELRAHHKSLLHHHLPVRHNVTHSCSAKFFDGGNYGLTVRFETIKTVIPKDFRAAFLQKPLLEHLLQRALRQH